MPARRSARCYGYLAATVALVFVATGTAIAVIGAGKTLERGAHNSAWAHRAGRVQTALNHTYRQHIQLQRQYLPGRPPHRVEIVVVDGTLRTDCRVPDDIEPRLTCTRPITLTRNAKDHSA